MSNVPIYCRRWIRITLIFSKKGFFTKLEGVMGKEGTYPFWRYYSP
jgi:hypothetical protein